MLKKENRLTTKEFQFVFQNSKKKFSKNFILFENFSQNQRNEKISVSISKKKYKRAVKRNKVRRLIYSILEKNFSLLKKNSWNILIVNSKILDFDFKEIEGELLFLLKKK